MLNIVYALCCIAVLRSQVVAKLIGRGGDRINSVVEKYLPTLACDSILVTPSYDIQGERDKKKQDILSLLSLLSTQAGQTAPKSLV